MEEAKEVQVLQQDFLSDAEDATTREHELSLGEAVKLYSKAMAWSVLMSTALIMDGYDFKLIGSLFAQPAFQRAYGKESSAGKYQISAPWQAGLNNGSNVGQMIGVLMAGSIVERIGFRRTMMMALVIVPGLIFIQFFASNLSVLETGQVLLGVPLGVFQTVTSVYALEVTPVCLRAYLTSYGSMCWLIGKLIASGVLRGVLDMQAPWAYRIPFAVQWFWPIPLLIAVFLAPESPWWLVRQNRLEDAKASLARLTSTRNTEFDADKTVTLMVLTTEHEREISASTSFLACFKGTDLRRTCIVVGCYIMEVLSGSTLQAYATYFFEQAGLATDQAFNMSIVAYAIGVVGVLTTWFLMPHIGRRTLYLYGLSTLAPTYILVGALGIPEATSHSSSLAWAIGALLLLTVYISNTTILPVSYSLVSEIPSSLLRSKSVVIARFCYAAVNIAANVVTPYQLNPTAWGWGARTGFVWGGACGIGWVFTYFYVPEPKGRTVAELDILFERGVKARRFAGEVVLLAEVTGVGRS